MTFKLILGIVLIILAVYALIGAIVAVIFFHENRKGGWGLAGPPSWEENAVMGLLCVIAWPWIIALGTGKLGGSKKQ